MESVTEGSILGEGDERDVTTCICFSLGSSCVYLGMWV
jgi:hypothetical protein